MCSGSHAVVCIPGAGGRKAKGKGVAEGKWGSVAHPDVDFPLDTVYPNHQLDLITILSKGANRVLCWREQMRGRDEKIEITGRGPRHPLHALETLNGPQALSLYCSGPLSILLHLMPRP